MSTDPVPAGTLYTVAYPVLPPEEARLIEHVRTAHDRLHDVIRAHFTLVFGCDAVPLDAYLAHVEAVTAATREIVFRCGRATLGAVSDGLAPVFLVPDEGYSDLARLHDALYTGPLAPHLCRERPYVPHLTVGTLASQLGAQALCDSLNDRGLRVSGVVNALHVGSIRGERFQHHAVYRTRA